MATVKENITNALTWFYERLKSNDLDPMQEQIDELNSNTMYSKSGTTGTASTGQWVTNASLELPKGTYLLIGHVRLSISSTQSSRDHRLSLRLSTNEDEAVDTSYSYTASPINVQVTDYVVLEQTTTVNMQFYSQTEGSISNASLRAFKIK